jgi:hypothetical protein
VRLITLAKPGRPPPLEFYALRVQRGGILCSIVSLNVGEPSLITLLAHSHEWVFCFP